MSAKVKLLTKYNTYIIAAILLAILMGHIVHSLFIYIALAVFCLYALVSDDETSICNLFFLMPFASLFKVTPGTMTLFTVCELFVVILFIVKRGLNSKIFVFVSLYTVYMVAGSITSSNLDMPEIIKQVVNMLMLYFFVKSFSECHYKRMFNYFIAAVIISSTIGWFGTTIIPNFNEFVKSTELVLTEEYRFSGLHGDPNHYSINVILAFVLSIVMYVKKMNEPICFWLCFGILTFFGFHTYSKSFLLMYIFVFLFALWRVIKSRNPIAYIVIIAFVSVLIYLAKTDNSVISMTIERLMNTNDVDDLTTGRSKIWTAYFLYVSERMNVLFFGRGINAPYLSIGVAHNAYIEIIYYLGIFGTILYILSVAIALRFGKREQKQGKKVFFNYIGWLSLMAMLFFLSTLFAYELVFHLFLSYCVYNTDFSDKFVENKKEL